MSNAEKTLITVATYNEMENLPRLVEEIFRFAPAADLLVIDDNSPDGTGHWCDEKAARIPASIASIGRGNWGWARPFSPA